MRIPICKSCGEVVNVTTAGTKNGHLYCRNCSAIHNATLPEPDESEEQWLEHEEEDENANA
jgi:uncharacterized Zn finger protein